MSGALTRFLSHDAGPFAQFVKYGAIGVAATCVQTGVFYVLASCWLRCLAPDDWAVRFLGLPAGAFTGGEAWYAARGTYAAVDTAVVELTQTEHEHDDVRLLPCHLLRPDGGR